MQTLTLNIKSEDAAGKIMRLLHHFGKGEIEIIEKDDIVDLQLLAATREDSSIPFEEYLEDENQHQKIGG